MRAFAVRKFAQPAGILDLPVPAIEGSYVIRVTYAGVNPIDYKLVEMMKEDSPTPFVLGIDFAGVIVSAPNGPGNLKAGDRVFGMARTHGAYAEYTAIAPGVAREPLTLIPDGVTNEQASTLPIAGTTALRSLQLLDLKEGQKLVVVGATGGVGGYAVQIARARGVHVIAVVRHNGEEALRLGAAEVHDHESGDVLDDIHAAHPDGLDAVLDLVSDKDAVSCHTEILRQGGRLASTLYAANEDWFKERHIQAYNLGSASNPFSSAKGLDELAGLLIDGTISTRINTVVSLDRASQVIETIKQGGLHGKAVIKI